MIIPLNFSQNYSGDHWLELFPILGLQIMLWKDKIQTQSFLINWSNKKDNYFDMERYFFTDQQNPIWGGGEDVAKNFILGNRFSFTYPIQGVQIVIGDFQ